MKLVKAALAVAVALGATTSVAVTAADAYPHYRTTRVCNVVFRHGHRERVCRTVRRHY